MSLRQVRLTTLRDIRDRLKQFTGKKINIVLRNRKVYFGELLHVDESQLTLADMRQQTVSLSLNDIAEVYLDFKE